MRYPFRSQLIRWVRPRADALVYASDAYVNLKSTMNDMSDHLIGFSFDPQGDEDLALLELLRFILPREWSPGRFVRLGRESDGGYVMDCDLDVHSAVSIGVGHDISWDQALANAGVRMCLFDHTVSGLPSKLPNSEFHRLGLGPKSEGHLRSLDDLVALARLPVGTRNILKIDVEGAEWDALASCDASVLMPFSQIAVELHNLDAICDAQRAETIKEALGVLTTNHIPVHMHANNYGRLFRASSYWFVDTLEMLFVSIGAEQKPPLSRKLFSQLDSPCDPRVSDISLANAVEAIRLLEANA